ncbi:protein kinase [Cylindrobasidium torrendii FP15055 ss-10]|uniref:Protein kinase n=1 Tax=Cylindrobasidium torrendii FP15055 ss-10 TaxID=1314674 RepID=A0A0D7BG62_9AGAR|nr:protein kinase [Cylindrobasidium torrendii FP15055 ss-10]
MSVFFKRALRKSAALPRVLEARHASNWTQLRNSKFPSFFLPTPRPRVFPRQRLLWLLPVAGGLYLSLTPEQKSFIPSLFSSPDIIPCHPERQIQTIYSPAELNLTIANRLRTFFFTRIWEPILTAKRFIRLCFLFIPVLVTSPMLLVGDPEKKLAGERWGAIWWYDFLVQQMELAGPTFVKLAQWAGSRTDLFPSVLCDRLGELHSHGKAHSLEHTKKVISRAFNRPFEEIFVEFDDEPIGSGAIAQVHRAVLKQDLIPPSYLGPRRHRNKLTDEIAPSLLKEPLPSVPTAAVAIKILHPRVAKTISRDLAIMSFFARFLTVFPGMHWISLPEEVDVFGDMMFQQLDLRNEADNLLTFEANFSPRNVPMTFPRPLKNWSTTELLVEEFQDALPLEAFLKNGGGPFDKQMATVGLDAFLNMLLLDNFVHSDLHPGNIMVKFTKPTSTGALLKNIVHALKVHFFPGTRQESEPAIPPPDLSDSDGIVSKLRSLASNRQEWLAELSKLYDEGYLPEVVFIDAGLVTSLSATNRSNFLELFRSLAEFDGYRAGQLMIERCRTPELAIDTETFALKMQHLVLTVKRKTFSLGQIKISDILTEVLRSVRKHHVKMEGDFINTVISILLLEGIGRQLDPDLDLFKSALPILRKLGGQMAGKDAIQEMPKNNLATFLKVWVWLEARDLIAASIVNADDLIKYDWLTQSI